MLKQDGEIIFGEWLPDLPFYDNPGLVEAKNVIPVDGSYKDYIELATADNTLVSRPVGAFAALDTAGDSFIYAATEDDIYIKSGSSWNDLTTATLNTAADGYERFTQFDSFIVATNYADPPLCATVGGATFGALATTGTAPNARQCGVINRFLVLGDTDVVGGTIPHRVQWSALGDPRNWPTPNTATARAVQSGAQILPAIYGAVTGIANGQFFGIILQQRGLTRFTYIGGDEVFQVQTYETTRGNWFPQSMTQVGNLTYFISADGFYVTDGATVRGTGDGKVDKTFMQDCDQTYKERVRSAIDYQNKCIFWCYPNFSASSGVPNQLIIYNWARDRFSHVEDEMHLIFSSIADGFTLDQLDTINTSIDAFPLSFDSPVWQGGLNTMMGFGTDNRLGTFAGSSAVARFETAEADMNPFGYVFIRGVRPKVTGNPTDITISLGTRTSQDNQGRTFGSAVQRTTRTGVCDFRQNARFITARMEITGGFDRAFGLDFDGEEGDGV